MDLPCLNAALANVLLELFVMIILYFEGLSLASVWLIHPIAILFSSVASLAKKQRFYTSTVRPKIQSLVSKLSYCLLSSIKPSEIIYEHHKSLLKMCLNVIKIQLY